MNRLNFILLAVSLSAPNLALASEVLRVGANGHTAAVSPSSGEAWKAGEAVCAKHKSQLICGKVIKNMAKGAIADFDGKVEKGDSVDRKTPERQVAAAESYATFNPGPEHAKYNVGFGIANALPAATISYVLADQYVLTGMINMGVYSGDGVDSILSGGAILIAGYMGKNFIGANIQLGVGFYNANTNYQGAEGNQFATSLIATVGYRTFVNKSNRWNVGLSGGVQYTRLSSTTLINVNNAFVQPLFLFDLSYAF